MISPEIDDILTAMIRNRKRMRDMQTLADALYEKYSVLADEIGIMTKTLASLRKRLEIKIDACEGKE